MYGFCIFSHFYIAEDTSVSFKSAKNDDASKKSYENAIFQKTWQNLSYKLGD